MNKPEDFDEAAAERIAEIAKTMKRREKAAKDFYALHKNWHLLTERERAESTQLADKLGLKREIKGA